VKNIRNCIVCFLIGLFISLPVGAAVQYSLSESAWKMVVDGQVVQDEKLPVLLMEPGYNYLPAGAFRAVCEKAGIGFTADVDSKEIRISTKQEVAAMSTKTAPASTPVTVTAEYTEPYTLERDGVKKAFIGDINKLLQPYGYKLKNSGYFDWKLKLCDKEDNILFKDISSSTHEYNGQPAGFIDYSFYEENIKPLITD
jgi:hypothetical protein